MPSCRILAVVESTFTFVNDNVKKGDWVVLDSRNDRQNGTSSYRAAGQRGTWGKLWVHYRPILNLDTGEHYDREE